MSVCVCVCPSAHTERPWLSISTHIRTLVLGLSTLALPVDCLGDFGPRGLSVQYTQDVRGCPPAHTGRPWVSVSTHRTSVAVCVCPSEHIGRPWLSISTHISTLVLGLSTLALPMDCSGDFGPRGLPVQYTQDVCGKHISTLVLGLSTLAFPVDCSGDFGPRGLSVQYTQDVRGCPSAHTQDVCGCPSAHTARPWLSVCVRQHTQDLRGCPSYTQDIRGCLPAHTGHPWLSLCVCVCPSVSFSTHRTSVAVHQYTYQHAGRWTQHAGPSRGLFGNFGPSGLSVQYTHDVRGCPSENTGRLWVSVSTDRTSVAVRVCPCVFVSTHRTSVAVHQYTYQHVGPWTHLADPSRGLLGLGFRIGKMDDGGLDGSTKEMIEWAI
ncbi:hypothetical protein YC2023_065979 [Brassica napus]